MAEITEEYISENPSPSTQTEPSPQGNIISRFFERTIDAGADRGLLLYTGLQSAIYPEKHEQYKQQRANAARMAELQLQQAETNLQTSQFNLEQAKINAPLNAQIKQQNLLNAQQQGRNLAMQYETAQEARPHNLARLKAQAEEAQFVLQQRKYKAYDQEAADYYRKGIDVIKNMVNFPQLNVPGRYIVENSPAVKALPEMSYLMHIANDPDKFQYQIRKLENQGWYVTPREDGELELQNQSGGKTISFVANPEGLKRFTEMVQDQLKDALTAARIIGTDAVNPGQATAKTVLSNPIVKQICGDEVTGYRVYSDLYNKKILNKKTGEWQDVFSPEQKMYHMSNILIGSALEDNMFSDAEKTTLLPQVQQMIKTLGGELKLGDSVDNTFVVWGRNQGYAQTYTIKDFLHNVLREKDVISPAFGEHLQLLAKQMKNNQSGGGDANNDVVKPPTPEEVNQLEVMFGSGIREESNEALAKLKQVMNDVQARSISKGFGYLGKDEKLHISNDFTDNKVAEAVAMEREIFDAANLGKYAENGFWHTLKDMIDAKKNKKSSEKIKKKIKELNDKTDAAVKQMPKGFFGSGASQQLQSDTAMISALLNIYDKFRNGNPDKKEKSTEEKLKKAKSFTKQGV